MSAKRVDVKLFASNASKVEPKELIPVFHGFIQRSAVEGELLIDVADYSHVVDGPGVMLIGHEGHYGYDLTKGRPGLLYSQRRARIDDSYEAAVAYGLRQALRVASLLEKEESLAGRLKFTGEQLFIRFNDRLNAPNTPATWERVRPAVTAVLGKAFGNRYSAQPAETGTGELFTVDVTVAKSNGLGEALAAL